VVGGIGSDQESNGLTHFHANQKLTLYVPAVTAWYAGERKSDPIVSLSPDVQDKS